MLSPVLFILIYFSLYSGWELMELRKSSIPGFRISFARIKALCCIRIQLRNWQVHLAYVAFLLTVLGLLAVWKKQIEEMQHSQLELEYVLFLVRLEHMSAESYGCVWKWHQDPDARLCSQQRQISWYEILWEGKTFLKCFLLYFPFWLLWLFSLLHSFFDTIIFLNDLITSLITIDYHTLPVLLGPKQH